MDYSDDPWPPAPTKADMEHARGIAAAEQRGRDEAVKAIVARLDAMWLPNAAAAIERIHAAGELFAKEGE